MKSLFIFLILKKLHKMGGGEPFMKGKAYTKHLVTKETKLMLLEKTMWNYKDIMDYFSISNTIAHRVIKEVVKKGGRCPYVLNRYFTDAILKEFKTTRADEINYLKGTIQNESNC